MAVVTRDSIKLSIEVQNGMTTDGTPRYSKKSINFKLKEEMTADQIAEKANTVMTLIADIMANNTRDFYITEASEMEADEV